LISAALTRTVFASLTPVDDSGPLGPALFAGPFPEQEIRQIAAAIAAEAAIILVRLMFHSFPMESSGKPAS
jgi:hypothetical protein